MNHELIEAITQGDFDAGINLVRAGADGTAHTGDPTAFSVDILLHRLHERVFGQAKNSVSDDSQCALALLLFSSDLYADTKRTDAPVAYEKLALALIDSGSPLKIKDRFGNTPMDMAVVYHEHQLVKRLIANDPQVDQDAGANMWRADATDTYTLLTNNIDPNVTQLNGETALFDAEGEKLTVLLTHGANVNATSKDGRTPLFEACKRGDDTSVNLLLYKSAAADDATTEGVTPILEAAAHCRLETVRRLAALGADINARTKTGDTAVMFAVTNEDERVLPWILDQSVDVNLRTASGRTALSLAIDLTHTPQSDPNRLRRLGRVIGLLRQRGAR